MMRSNYNSYLTKLFAFFFSLKQPFNKNVFAYCKKEAKETQTCWMRIVLFGNKSQVVKDICHWVNKRSVFKTQKDFKKFNPRIRGKNGNK